ncbi:MAG: hypothetical protein QG673_271 [Pseudomonadota bacterium]|nr:hypothetical protein [Pseudomonadota bacterium]
MMRILLLILLFGFGIVACSTTNVPQYNQKEFETANYQKNVDNAIDAADLLSDFDQNNIPDSKVDAADIANLVQGNLYYNQGEYAQAFPFYNILALKYKDPRIIYKAIICLEHVSVTQEQAQNLNSLVNLFIQTDPDSRLARLFKIRMAISNQEIAVAESNLDSLMKENSDNGRVILLFISSVVSTDVGPDSYNTLVEFANYVIANYSSYPEAHMVAILSYAVGNNTDGLDSQISYIQTNYPSWLIPLYWSADLLVRNNHFVTLVKILQPLVTVDNPDKVLQNLYVAALFNLKQTDQAKAYLNTQLATGVNHNNILIDLGMLSIQNGAYTEALIYFNQVVPNNKPLTNVLALLKGAIYDYQGQTSNAIVQYRLVSDGPLLAISDIMLLNAYLNTNDYTSTNNILDKLAQQDKLNDMQTILFKSGYYLGESKYRWGYDLLNRKLSVYGKNPEYLYQYAVFSGMMNYTKQSISLYKKYLKQNPDRAFAYNDLGYIYADQTRDYKQAKKYADKAYKLAPNDPNVLDTLGWIYYKLGDYNKALSYIKSSYDMNYSVDSAHHLVAVYLALNRQDLAHAVKIIDKAQLQQQLKLQVIYKLQVLLSYLQFGIEVK